MFRFPRATFEYFIILKFFILNLHKYFNATKYNICPLLQNQAAENLLTIGESLFVNSMNIQETFRVQPVLICEQHELFGIASANIHEYLDHDPQLDQGFSRAIKRKQSKTVFQVCPVIISITYNLQNLNNSRYKD